MGIPNDLKFLLIKGRNNNTWNFPFLQELYDI